jgi:uncharacterized membrane protein YphA (DoxX/SURF4 family)
MLCRSFHWANSWGDSEVGKVTTILFAKPKPWAEYALVVLRLVIAGLWINSDIGRWSNVAAGRMLSNGMVRALFGVSIAPSLTLFFTILETVGALALILGLLTRLVAVWGVIEFAITSVMGVTKDFALLAGCLVLLFYGSFVLSVDGFIAKKFTRDN